MGVGPEPFVKGPHLADAAGMTKVVGAAIGEAGNVNNNGDGNEDRGRGSPAVDAETAGRDGRPDADDNDAAEANG